MRGWTSIEPYQLPTAPEPGLQQMEKEFNEYAPGIPQTVFTLPGGPAVHMFADVANKLPTVTRASVLAAFQHLTNQYAYDLIPPYTTSVSFKGLGDVDFFHPCTTHRPTSSRSSSGALVQLNGGAPFNPFAG